jgi:hypothetical protein
MEKPFREAFFAFVFELKAEKGNVFVAWPFKILISNSNSRTKGLRLRECQGTGAGWRWQEGRATEKEFYCRKRCLGEKFLRQKVKLIRKQKAWNCSLVA